MPISALLTCQSLQCYSRHGFIDDAAATQGIVNAQRAFLVGTQHETRTELLIIVTGGKFHILIVTFYIEMRDSPPLEIRLVAGQGIFQELKPRTCIDIFTAQVQVQIGIGQHLVITMFSTDFVIILRNKDVTLDTTTQRHLSENRRCYQQHNRQQQGYQFFRIHS